MLTLLQKQAIIDEIITTKYLRENLTVALASNSLKTIQEIELGITLLSNDPELAKLFFKNFNPHILNKSYVYIGKDEKLQERTYNAISTNASNKLTPLAALLLKSIESLNEETKILFIKNVIRGMTGTTDARKVASTTSVIEQTDMKNMTGLREPKE